LLCSEISVSSFKLCIGKMCSVGFNCFVSTTAPFPTYERQVPHVTLMLHRHNVYTSAVARRLVKFARH